MKKSVKNILFWLTVCFIGTCYCTILCVCFYSFGHSLDSYQCRQLSNIIGYGLMGLLIGFYALSKVIKLVNQ